MSDINQIAREARSAGCGAKGRDELIFRLIYELCEAIGRTQDAINALERKVY